MNTDWLDDALKHNNRYADDAGFTAQVVAALPKRRRLSWLRPVVIGATFVAGLGIAMWVLPVDNALVTGFVRLLHARSLSTIPLMPVVLIALTFWGTITAATREN